MTTLFKNLMLAVCLGSAVGVLGQTTDSKDRTPLPGTAALETQGDIASQLVAGVDKFLLGQIDKSVERRAKYWHRDYSSAIDYNKSIATNRYRLGLIIGAREARPTFHSLELLATTSDSATAGKGDKFTVQAVRWPAFRDVHGEGLLLTPDGGKVLGNVVAIPDADQTPEQIAGLAPGVPAASQYARRLAESGFQVLVPTLVNRKMEQRRGAKLTNREFLYRPAFELGRGLVGYEVQKVLAAVDWFSNEQDGVPNIGVIGWGEGGLIALHASALDSRVDATMVSGYFDNRNNLWQEPIDRNIFGLLDQFGDAELASMYAPRKLIVEAARGPELTLPGQGGAPARLVTPKLEDVRKEVDRANAFITPLKDAAPVELVVSGEGRGDFASEAALQKFVSAMNPGAKLAPLGRDVQNLREQFNPEERLARQMHEIDVHNQWLLTESPYTRSAFMKNLDFNSPEAYERSSAVYRKFFAEEVIGRFEETPLPANVRSRKTYENPKWTGYEVAMDVFPDVIAYGILLVPKGMKDGEKRPVVVCQHGLEGRPQDVVKGDAGAYHDFAAKLAERGFITFAPQNLYIFTDRFRTLQRKGNNIKKTLFSVITPQHQQIVDWLKTLPNVDPKRIAFYGLSYGGKTAMRVPALVTDYCLSICSADFNEWVWKNASTRSPYSYTWSGEYEIFEFDLGSTFNYAEMASLIAPRPFMVERGHYDGVAPDEAVGYEFGKVRFLYEAKLKLEDKCELETFVGPHTINGKGTFDFLHKHLNWPKP